MNCWPKGDYYFIDVTNVSSLPNNTIITAICGAADENSCDDVDKGNIKRILYSFKLITTSVNDDALPQYSNSMKGLFLVVYFTVFCIFF